MYASGDDWSKTRRKTTPVPPCAAPGCKDPNGGRPNRGYTRPMRVEGRPYGVDGVLCDTCYRRLHRLKRLSRVAPETPGAKPRVIPDGARWCGHCRRVKREACFYPCAYGPGGRRFWCMACDRADASVRAGTKEHKATRVAYRARPECREADRLGAARRRRERPGVQAEYRQTPRVRALDALDAARRRLRANPCSKQVAATVAAWEAELARLGWEPRARQRRRAS